MKRTDERLLVLVTGAGRSGTSTIAGTLHHLGFHVPQPVLPTNRSNPRGFFESTWPLRFHQRIMAAAGIEQIDGRPEAAGLMSAAVTPELRAELRAWLSGELATAPRVVVKDPRSAWVPQLWDGVGTDLGASVRYLTMLRHPAEIVGSRSSYYPGIRDRMGAWDFAVMNLCGWVNINLVVERHTRSMPRAWVRYTDLLSDWRSVLDRVGAQLQVDFGIVPGEPHPVDDFIDADLRRHDPDWSDLDMPEELRQTAELVWRAGTLLADGHGHSEEADLLFDEARSRYDRMFREAVAIARDDTVAKVRDGQAEARRALRRRLRRQQARERAEREAARGPVRRLVRRGLRGVRRLGSDT